MKSYDVSIKIGISNGIMVIECWIVLRKDAIS
jgi:hypothetical protein